MMLDLTQSPPKPVTLAESHKVIKRLWMFTRHATEKLKGTQLTGTTTARVCTTLLHKRKSLWHFLKKSTIDPTNNLAERNLRHAVLWRKKTFGTRSERGNRFLERTLTVMMTAKQAGENIIHAISS